MASQKMAKKPSSTVTPLQILLLLNDSTPDAEVAQSCNISSTKLSKAKYHAYAFTPEERKRVAKHFRLPKSFNFDLLVDKAALKHLLSLHLTKGLK